METVSTCFNCWEQSLEDMVYLGVRRDMYMMMGDVEGMEMTANGVSKTTYGLVLCADCFYEPKKIDTKIIFSYIQEHYAKEFPEYAEVVSGALKRCMDEGDEYLMDAYDNGEAAVLLSELRDPREKRWKGEHLFEKYVLFPVFRKDEDRVV